MAGRRFVMSSRRFLPSGQFGGFVLKLTRIARYKTDVPADDKLILRQQVVPPATRV